LAQPDATSSVTLRDYVSVIWLRKWLVAIVIVACTLTAFLLADSKTRMYQATALMMYQPPANVANPLGSDSSTDINTLALQVQSVVNTVNSPAVSSRGIDLLRQSDPSAHDYTVTAAIMPPDSSAGSTLSDVVGVTAVSALPTVSAAAANAYAQAIIDLRRESEQARFRKSQDAIRSQMKQFSTKASKLSTDYLLLNQRLRDLQVAEATVTGGFTIIRPATPPASPSSPKPIQSAVVGFGVGLFAGIVLAFVVGQFDTRVRSHTRVGEILGLPVLGRVPRLPRRLLRDGPLVALTEPAGGVAEALRALRSNLDWTRIDDGWTSLLITSSHKGEGKTLTLCNLAITLALAGKKVVLIDADLRDPQVHKAFTMSNETGLTTVLQGTLSLATSLRRFDLDRSNGSGAVAPPSSASAVPSGIEKGSLLVLTSGPPPPNPGEVVASRALATTLARLANTDADYVLVDAPPIFGVGDAGVLTASIDGILFVANIDQIRGPTLEEGRQALDALPCRKLGVVVVGEPPASTHYHNYGYGRRRKG
jgi:Mrp family chromosome partitioning ATPase/capsular polysaccharide biosynthesis protein